MYRKDLTSGARCGCFEKSIHGGLGRGTWASCSRAAASARPRSSCRSRSTICCAAARSSTSRSTRPSTTCAPTTTRSSTSMISSTHLEDARRRARRRRPPAATSAPTRRAASAPRSCARRSSSRARRARRRALLIVEGLRPGPARRATRCSDLQALARELQGRVCSPASVARRARRRACRRRSARSRDLLSVVLALEPADAAVALRALKDHTSPDLSALHVALDPKTLLLKRS